MFDPSRYFDHAATSPMDRRVVEAMLPYMTEHFGNPHAIHAAGKFLEHKIGIAREEIAALLGAQNPDSIIFTSGATETNNWILQLNPEMRVSPFEHSSVRRFAQLSNRVVLENRDYEIETTGVNSASIVLVCNETGAIPSYNQRPEVLHRDITQAIGYVPFHLDDYDFASSSFHKIGGPIGIGLLFAREPYDIKPMIYGGNQESGLRSGTLSAPLIIGAAESVKIAITEREDRLQKTLVIRRDSLDFLNDSGVLFGTDPVTNHSPHILSLNFPGIEGQTLVLAMDELGWMISAGAACSSDSIEPSPTLLALGYTEEQWRSTIRISFGASSSIESTIKLLSDLTKYIKKVRKCN